MPASPGWYPDPAEYADQRWWLGDRWSDRIVLHGAESLDPLPEWRLTRQVRRGLAHIDDAIARVGIMAGRPGGGALLNEDVVAMCGPLTSEGPIPQDITVVNAGTQPLATFRPCYWQWFREHDQDFVARRTTAAGTVKVFDVLDISGEPVFTADATVDAPSKKAHRRRRRLPETVFVAVDESLAGSVTTERAYGDKWEGELTIDGAPVPAGQICDTSRRRDSEPGSPHVARVHKCGGRLLTPVVRFVVAFEPTCAPGFRAVILTWVAVRIEAYLSTPRGGGS